MSDDIVTVNELESLAGRLENLDLDDHELRTLGALFFLAGTAIADSAPEVEGFMPTAVESVAFNFSSLPRYAQPGANGLLLPAVKGQDGQLVGLLHTGLGKVGAA
jgi:hypothetical protein